MGETQLTPFGLMIINRQCTKWRHTNLIATDLNIMPLNLAPRRSSSTNPKRASFRPVHRFGSHCRRSCGSQPLLRRGHKCIFQWCYVSLTHPHREVKRKLCLFFFVVDKVVLDGEYASVWSRHHTSSSALSAPRMPLLRCSISAVELSVAGEEA